MATVFRMALYGGDAASASRAADAAFARIAALEAVYSDYKDDSELTRLNNAAGLPAQPASADLWNALALSQEVAAATDGAFDITAAPVVRLWRKARRVKQMPDAKSLAAAVDAVGWRRLRLEEPGRRVGLTAKGMRLDLGGIAKGIACDEAFAELRKQGFGCALVAGGGDIRLGDPPPGAAGWTVAIANYDRPDAKPAADVPPRVLANCAISTSGDAEQWVDIGGKRYSHIVDPKTGLGLTTRLQATVVAPNSATADAWATAVCVLGSEEGFRRLEKLSGTAALTIQLLPEGRKILRSPRWGKETAAP